MTQAILDVPEPLGAELDAPLYRHSKRPEWGVGILVSEQDDGRVYQFEDGRLRTIRRGYYKLLEPADDLGERADHIRENLQRVVTAGDDDSDKSVVDAVCPFSMQVALFKRLYPGGFEDPEWIADHRRSDGSALKRHRGPISERARKVLTAARMEDVVSSAAHVAFVDIIADILAHTDLVPVSHAKALRGLEDAEKRSYVESVAELLHAEGRYEPRFKKHLDTLEALFDERPSWRIATVLPALVHPQTHVAVRRSAFIRQAGSIAPTARYTRRARVAAYRNFRRVATGVRERLNAAGHEPRDLLDVHDFIWTTLRTSALEHLGPDR